MFPAGAFENAIRDEISSAINDRPVPRAGWEPEVDSMVVIRVVLRIEEEFALQLPDTVMPSGGFGNIEHCVGAIMQACRDLWKVSQPQTEEA